MNSRILVVDDEKSLRTTLRLFLVAQGYEVDLAENAHVALRRLNERDYDIILSDIIMPELSGVDLLRKVRAMAGRPEVILITGEPTVETAAEAVRLGAYDYIAKPVTKQTVLRVVAGAERLCRLSRDKALLEEENNRYRENLEKQVAERSRELQKLAEVSVTVTGDPNEVFTQITEILLELIQCTTVGIAEVFGDEMEIIRIQNSEDLLMEPGERIPLDGMPCKQVVTSGEICILDHLTERFPDNALIEKIKADSYCGIPVFTSEGKVTGVMFFMDDQSHHFTLEDTRVMQIFARRVGLELERKAHLQEKTNLNMEKARLEEQYLQSQKMESVGRLAGGIAHDFNNLLTAIIGSLELLEMDLDLEGETKDCLDSISEASTRARKLIEHLLTFSRKQPITIETLDLCRVVSDFCKFISRTVKEHIKISISLPEQPVLVNADPNQLEQVLMNLVVNAEDAMPQGGALALRMGFVDKESSRSHSVPLPGSGTWIQLTVSDTGCGMVDEIRTKVFEPFFTTKAWNKGTGLGLATVYGIIHQHKGHIEVESQPGKGTTFRIYLPLAAENVVSEKGREIIDPDAFRGSETILIAEDEDSVRLMVSKALDRFGYKVIQSNSTQEAIKLFEAHSDSVSLLITDVIMPGMSGKELADSVLRVYPDTKVLFMSGYTDDIIKTAGTARNGLNFIEKPFSPSQLAVKVRSVLDSGCSR